MTANTAITKREVAQAEIQEHRGLTATLAAKFEMEPAQFLKTIKDTVMPSSATKEEVCAFLMVSKEYGLNPLLREIHAFPKKGGGIQTVVGIDGWAKIITNHKDFDGCQFEYEVDEKGFPVATTCILYRKNCSHPVSITEYYIECRRESQPWKDMPRRMLRHKSLMQCGRIAFGISGIMDEDEARDLKEVTATTVPEGESLLTPGTHRKPGRPKKTVEAPAQAAPDADQAAPAPGSSPESGDVLPSQPAPTTEIPPAQGATEREPGSDDGEPEPKAKPDLPPTLQRLLKMHETHSKMIDAEMATANLMPLKTYDMELIAANPDIMAKLSRIIAKVVGKISK